MSKQAADGCEWSAGAQVVGDIERASIGEVLEHGVACGSRAEGDGPLVGAILQQATEKAGQPAHHLAHGIGEQCGKHVKEVSRGAWWLQGEAAGWLMQAQTMLGHDVP